MSPSVDGGSLPVAAKSFYQAKIFIRSRMLKVAIEFSCLESTLIHNCQTFRNWDLKKKKIEHFENKQLCMVPSSWLTSRTTGSLENKGTLVGFVLDPGVWHLQPVKHLKMHGIEGQWCSGFKLESCFLVIKLLFPALGWQSMVAKGVTTTASHCWDAGWDTPHRQRQRDCGTLRRKGKPINQPGVN